MRNTIMKLNTLSFMVLLVGFMTLNIMMSDLSLSNSERRLLKQFPEFTSERLMSGVFMDDFEDYALDQFAFREFFRHIKAEFELKVFRKSDVNDIYLYDGHLVKMTKPYSQDSVNHFVQYIQLVTSTYLQGLDTYISIVPDKNYFVTDSNYTKLDYDLMESTIIEGLERTSYIDIMDILSLDDYYTTDTHWRQEALFGVVDAFSEAMDLDVDLEIKDFDSHKYEAFYGIYYGQAALNMPSDDLIYLEGQYFQDVIINNYEYLNRDDLEIYDETKLGEMDAYDVFLSGASPLIEIVNPSVHNQRELILFRDSFASSMAPLFLSNYEKITLIDTRYVSYEILGQFVDFSQDHVEKDILFLYNTEVINNSLLLK